MTAVPQMNPEQLAATQKHPWVGGMSHFEDMALPMFVIKITSEAESLKALLEVSNISGDSSGQMALAEALSAWATRIRVVDSTSAILSLSGVESINMLTGIVKSQVESPRVGGGISLIRALMTGDLNIEIPVAPASGERTLFYRVCARVSQQDQLFLMVSAREGHHEQRALTQVEGLRKALDMTAELVALISLDGKIQFLNQGCETIFGRPDISAGRDITEFMTPSSRIKFAELTTFLPHSEIPWTGEMEFRHPGGQIFPARCQVSNLRGSRDKSSIGFCVSGYRGDTKNFLTSHVQKLQRALSESERLALVGRLSGHIIHEINNPITVISGKAEKIKWLVSNLGAESLAASLPQLDDSAEKIIKMTDRMNKIIRGVKNMSRDVSVEPVALVSVSGLLNEVDELIQIVAKKQNVKVTFVSVEDLRIHVRALQISQVLINLITNSIDAVCDINQAWVSVTVSVDSSRVYFRVTDAGRGLTPEVREHLFDQYFTTKASGQGTGIGLPLSRQIARDHGGDLYLDETSEHTCFVLKLPLGGGLGADTEVWEEI